MAFIHLVDVYILVLLQFHLTSTAVSEPCAVSVVYNVFWGR